jgi:lycopene beta-cyclase
MQSSSLYQYKYYDYRYEYDYVFTGAGAAGLSMLVRMLKSGKFNDKTFLLVDKDRKDQNDRTWCFWEKGPGLFDEIVYKQWDKTWFHGPGFSKQFTISPYRYKMIRGIDFYNHCINYIKTQENVRILFEPVDRIENRERYARLVLANGEDYFARNFMFNSILFEQPVNDDKTQLLLQHFRGWFIETTEPFFDPGTNTLMDFRVNQEHGSTFVYTMPFDEHRALIEYTLFTEELLTPEAYDKGLNNYIRDFLKLEKYTITEKEFGVIPMTNYRFSPGEGRIINIGTAGGKTKSSSGYTFQFIQKNSSAMLNSLISNGTPRIDKEHSGRFRFYDHVLLDVLKHKELNGADIFTRLFKRNPVQRIFRFLDNESWLPEELLLMGSLPTMPFLRAARRVV